MKILAVMMMSGFMAMQATSFADATPTLKQVMDSMGADFKTLSAQIADPTKNASSLQAVGDLETLIPQAAKITPDSISSLPQAQQAAALAQYDTLMNNLLQAAEAADQALRANNQSAAIAAVSQMSSIRGDGHDQFKNN